MILNKITRQSALDPWPWPKHSLNSIVTSPPYWALRDYRVDGQIGMEHTPEEYVDKMVQVFSHAYDALAKDGTLWLNLGDTYMGGKGANGASLAYMKKYGANDRINAKSLLNTSPGEFRPNDRSHPYLKAKSLCGIPWRVAIALQQTGWILRQDIIWHKPNCQPAPVFDRCVTSHEYIFLFVKQRKYFLNMDALREPGVQQDKRNMRSVWSIPPDQLKDAHYASMPEKIPYNCIAAGTPAGGLVCDPFTGAGTVPLVAQKMNRDFVGLEIKQEYIDIAERRLRTVGGLFNNI